MRPLREDVGNRVGREGEPFLAHRVSDRWSENTAADCEDRLSKQQEIVQGLRPILTSVEQFKAYLETEINFPLEHQRWLDQQRQLLETRFNKNTDHEILEAEYQQVKLLKIELNRILASNSIFLAEQTKENQKLRNRQSEIAIATHELEEWKNSANSSIYSLLKQCLQKRLFVTEDLVSLPAMGLILAKKTYPESLPWTDTCDSLMREINQLITQCIDWDEICKVANRIYWLLFQIKSSLVDQQPSQDHISRSVEQLNSTINSTQLLQIFTKLLQISQRVFYQYQQSQEPQEPYRTAIKVEAIKQKCEALIEQHKPSGSELILNRITAKYGYQLKAGNPTGIRFQPARV